MTECIVCESESPFGPDVLLRCPICRFEFVHIEAISLIDSSGRVVTATPGLEDGQGGMRVIQGIQPVEGQRRHVVELSMSCEEQHFWVLRLAQDRGLTLVAATEVAAEMPAPRPTGGTAA